MIDETLSHFIYDKHIDSVQKLFFLFYLYQHPKVRRTGPELSQQLYLGFTPQFEKMIADLCKTGLVDKGDNGYELHNEPQIITCLQQLINGFEDPLVRQQILSRVNQRPSWGH